MPYQAFKSLPEILVPDSNSYNEEELELWSTRYHKVVDDVDVKNLLNEEVEKSRNILLIFTGACVALGLFGDVAITYLGLKFQIKPLAENSAKVFLVCIALILAAYYIFNSKADHAHKMSGTNRLKLLNQEFKKYLGDYLDDRENKIKSSKVNSNDRKVHEERSELAEEYLNWLSGFSKKFDTQSSWVERMPKVIAMGCICFVIFSLFIYPTFHSTADEGLKDQSKEKIILKEFCIETNNVDSDQLQCFKEYEPVKGK